MDELCTVPISYIYHDVYQHGPEVNSNGYPLGHTHALDRGGPLFPGGSRLPGREEDRLLRWRS